MPIFDWQFIVVIVALAAAAWYVVCRGLGTFRSRRQKAGKAEACGSCGACGSGETPSGGLTSGFVPLEDLAANSKRRSSPNSP